MNYRATVEPKGRMQTTINRGTVNHPIEQIYLKSKFKLPSLLTKHYRAGLRTGK
jgi:hypothetical protein